MISTAKDILINLAIGFVGANILVGMGFLGAGFWMWVLGWN